MINNLSFRVLQHCRDDFLPITPLIDKSTSRSALYRCKGKLCEKGWLETDGKDRYRTTEQGIQQLQSLLGEVPDGLATVYPPLKQVPTRALGNTTSDLTAIPQ
jgi:DNA-binding PadR family transcriptional regulator